MNLPLYEIVPGPCWTERIIYVAESPEDADSFGRWTAIKGGGFAVCLSDEWTQEIRRVWFENGPPPGSRLWKEQVRLAEEAHRRSTAQLLLLDD